MTFFSVTTRGDDNAIPESTADWLTSAVDLTSMYGKTLAALAEEVIDMHRRLHLRQGKDSLSNSSSLLGTFDIEPADCSADAERPTYTVVQPTPVRILGRRTGSCFSFKSYRTLDTQDMTAASTSTESDSVVGHTLQRDISFLTTMESDDYEVGYGEKVDVVPLPVDAITDHVCEWGYFVDMANDQESRRRRPPQMQKYRSFLKREIKAASKR